MKTYRAIEAGYDGQRIIPVGKVFTTDIPQGKWMEEVKAKEVEKPAAPASKSTSK